MQKKMVNQGKESFNFEDLKEVLTAVVLSKCAQMITIRIQPKVN
jgi:hypothetical protein